MKLFSGAFVILISAILSISHVSVLRVIAWLTIAIRRGSRVQTVVYSLKGSAIVNHVKIFGGCRVLLCHDWCTTTWRDCRFCTCNIVVVIPHSRQVGIHHARRSAQITTSVTNVQVTNCPVPNKCNNTLLQWTRQSLPIRDLIQLS